MTPPPGSSITEGSHRGALRKSSACGPGGSIRAGGGNAFRHLGASTLRY